jgi:hypothetical protein
MDTFFALLTFASFIFLLIGIISPKASLFWLKGASNRTKSIPIYRLALTTGIVLFQITYSPENLSNNNQNAKTEVLASSPEENKQNDKTEAAPSTNEETEISIESRPVEKVNVSLTAKWFSLKPTKKESYIEDMLAGE